MFWNKPKNKEEHRYYLLPGMGKANHRKHVRNFRVSILIGLIISALLAGLLVYFNNRRRGIW